MKISTFLATGLGAFLLAGAANAAIIPYHAELTGVQSQNGSYSSAATATADFDFDDEAKIFTNTSTLVYADMPVIPTGAQLRSGACTEPGALISSLTLDANATKTSGIFSYNNTTPLDDDQIEALKGGNLYLAINNTTYAPPSSEIRGQILPKDAANDHCAAALAADANDAGTDSGVVATNDAGTGTPTSTTTTTTSDSGCNTTGSSSPGSSAALALGLGLALYGMARKRKQA